MVRNRKKIGKINQIVSPILVSVILLATIFPSSVSASSTLEDRYDVHIEVSMDNKVIDLQNEPFIENNTVYLPLREILNLAGIENEDIVYDNGYIQFLIYAETPVEYRGQMYDFWVNRVQIGSIYTYICGHSYGSTENSAILREPILKNDTTYVPYDLFDKLKESEQGFKDISVSVQTNNDTVLSGILYRNDEMNFQIELPLNWCGKYQIEFSDNFVNFIQTATRTKYEYAGKLFYIERVETRDLQQEFDSAIRNRKIVWQDKDYTYFLGTPTDIQYPVYPIWVDRDKDEVEIAEEYEMMFADIDFVENSFDTIVKRADI